MILVDHLLTGFCSYAKINLETKCMKIHKAMTGKQKNLFQFLPSEKKLRQICEHQAELIQNRG